MKLTGIDQARVKVILNPVITPDLFQKSRVKLSHPWFLPGQPPVVLGIGRLTAEKNYKLLIEAFRLVRKRLPARLLILGEGILRPELEALIAAYGLEHDVSLPGFVENPYVYLANAALFVLSSDYEGLPTVLIEALAVGRSIISTDCQSGPREILEEGKFGSLVPVGDVDILAERMHFHLQGKFDAPNPESALHAYELDTVTRQYLRLLFD